MKLTNKQKLAIRNQLFYYSESILLAKDDEASGCPDILRSLDDQTITDYCLKVLNLEYV